MKVAMEAASGSPLVATPRNRPLLIKTSRTPASNECMVDDSTTEPVSPLTRLMEDIYVVVIIGLGVPLNLAAFRSGIESQLARYPRFRSIQVVDSYGEPRWVRTTVNVDDHIVVPRPDPAAVAANPDQVVGDYASSLVTLPMDLSCPLWEFHFLDFPTSEATSTAVIRVHHSLGDGMSLITLLIASTRSAADPTSLPAMPPGPSRTGVIYEPPRSAGALGFVAWVWSYLVLAWHTLVDVAFFAATVVFLKDPYTLFKRADDGGELHRKRFVHQSFSLEDIKFIKNAMNCTVNDVLVGMTSAALSRYYFRRSGDSMSRRICLRSVLVVNIRPTSLQTCVHMIESGNSNEVTWGNQLGYILLPFNIALHNDPLTYVREAKKMSDRKKRSLEVIFTNRITQFFLKYIGLKAGAFLFSRMPSHTTMSFTSMVGPAEQVEFCGHPVVFIAPSIYGIPEALTVHYQSYNKTIKIVLAVDEDRFPDYDELLDDFVESLWLIKDATLTPPK